MINYRKSIIKDIYPKYKFVHLTGLLPDVISTTSDFNPKDRPLLYELGSKIATFNSNSLIHLRQCINDAKKGIVRYVYYDLAYLRDTIPEETLTYTSYHATSVILDFEKYNLTGKAGILFFDSSYKHDVEYNTFSKAVLGGIQFDLKTNIGLNTEIISFNLGLCPGIQGSGSTCAIWSLFIFYIYVLNPDDRMILQTLYLLDQNERDKILAHFLYYIGDLGDKSWNFYGRDSSKYVKYLQTVRVD